MKATKQGLKISKAEVDWLGSKEHFDTEKSYEEHLEDLKKGKALFDEDIIGAGVSYSEITKGVID